ncbi:hypothetical protein ASD44_11780 [Mesorhizobium sp. Root554]|uniref:NrsF family protein n=1 Tax=unclassified Mesorhizobium TaxID=325217 RepID=UPI0006FF6D8C|nr:MULTISPECIES: NrsF family protein [unclassified Mesorhizobium]KQZ14670.1 hypothetical protein ASD27_11790 [Mesorhizobium sp. Root1471]KQZ37177.1 hypothetical protein ASD44_11780 [Mesorhizobium sp. Root554]
MKTDDLIKALNADAAHRTMPLGAAWWLAAALAAAVAAAVFFSTIGPRPDFNAADHTVRFLLKFVFAGSLAVAAFACVRALSYPGASVRRRLPWLLAPLLLMAAAVIAEMILIPRQDWVERLIGTNMKYCLMFIPMIGIGPLVLFIAALRYGAPPRPGLAGAMAGLLAGGLAATFYAAHCPDDSPLFVATWYTVAIAGLSLLGLLGGRLFIRW